MNEKSGREIVERYMRALVEQDFAMMAQLRHPEYVTEWPQSGERVRGVANIRAIEENYPGSFPKTEAKALHGTADRWVATPVGTVLRITGSGDVYTGLVTMRYPDDSRVWHVMLVAELRDGKVLKETIIFGAPFEAPAWRAQWVERM